MGKRCQECFVGWHVAFAKFDGLVVAEMARCWKVIILLAVNSPHCYVELGHVGSVHRTDRSGRV